MGKNQAPIVFNWQSTDPRTAFLPGRISNPSGVSGGTMSSTATIYSQIIDVSNVDNLGFEFSWTGTPTGTLSLLGSDSGASFFAITPSPTLTQPAGSATGFLTGINQYQHKYIMISYVNASGTGVLKGNMQVKSLS